MEWSEGGECDHCNGIINKYIFKKEMNKQEKQTKSHRHRQPFSGYLSEGDGWIVKVKGGQIYGDGG